jgi:hypothetical protein
MDEKENAATPERRRFLRESLTGSVPLMLGWLGGRATELWRLAHGRAAPRTSAPPVAPQTAPPEAKQKLDQHYEEFARENPDAKQYPGS